jgi:hypothetical protein
MPKNRSARRRVKARELAAKEKISYAEALRRLTQQQITSGTESGSTVTTVEIRSAQAGGMNTTAVEQPIPSHALLLAELMRAATDTGTYDVVLIDPDPTTARATNERLRAQLGDQGYARLVDSLAAAVSSEDARQIIKESVPPISGERGAEGKTTVGMTAAHQTLTGNQPRHGPTMIIDLDPQGSLPVASIADSPPSSMFPQIPLDSEPE